MVCVILSEVECNGTKSKDLITIYFEMFRLRYRFAQHDAKV